MCYIFAIDENDENVFINYETTLYKEGVISTITGSDVYVLIYGRMVGTTSKTCKTCMYLINEMHMHNIYKSRKRDIYDSNNLFQINRLDFTTFFGS